MSQVFNKITGLGNDFRVIDEDQFKNKEYIITNKEYIENLLETIKSNSENKNKENYIFVIDSNIGLDHAKDSFGVIEKKIFNEKANNDFSLNYIPMNIGFDKNIHKRDVMKYNNVKNDEEYEQLIKKSINSSITIIENIAEKFKDKNVAINESFVNFIRIDKLDKYKYNNVKNIKLSFEDLKEEQLKGKMKDIENNNNEKLNLLINNSNVVLYKSAGNYVYNSEHYKEKFKLEIIMRVGTNNNYKFMKEISLMMNQIIEHKIYNNWQEIPNLLLNTFNSLKKNIEDFNQNKKEKNKIKLDLNDFIDLYIKDYLANYESYDLLKKINHFKIDNIKIVEATNGQVIKDNYEIAKKLNNLGKIKDLENLSSNLNYDLNEIEDMIKLYNKYSEIYPEIFKINALGSFSTLQFHDTIGIRRGIDGQNGTNLLNSNTGTSTAAPMMLSYDLFNDEKLSKKFNLKDLKQEIENNIEDNNLFFERN